MESPARDAFPWGLAYNSMNGTGTVADIIAPWGRRRGFCGAGHHGTFVLGVTTKDVAETVEVLALVLGSSPRSGCATHRVHSRCRRPPLRPRPPRSRQHVRPPEPATLSARSWMTAATAALSSLELAPKSPSRPAPSTLPPGPAPSPSPRLIPSSPDLR